MPFDYKILQSPYDRKHWKILLQELFPSDLDFFAQEVDLHDSKNERIESFTQFGNISLSDRFSSELALFEVRLKPRTTKLHINRVALREIVDKMRRDTAITGALAVFVDEELGKWRFTFIAKADVFGEKTVETTDPKRYTYVLGEGERTRTAEDRFKLLASKAQKSLEDVIEAFSVEKVNIEFFKKYKALYEECWKYLAEPTSGAYEIFKINPKIADDRARKPLRDFAKRLMGRLVFLYFLQKKGWMGCPSYTHKWENGDPDFIYNLFKSLLGEEKKRFYSKYLTELFFNTLNKSDRDNHAFKMPGGEIVRVPYLNGGLFDKELHNDTNHFNFPAEWFSQLFEFFDQYNFTIDESSPNDQEVGIDPEMLGHIFENLLEENREKGAYYTPKEIVHYMCQESLLLYLKNELLGKQAPYKGVVWSDSRATDEQELEHFVRFKERGRKESFIYRNGRTIEKALQQVRICDPAIGSGAFPMGLLYEIFHCHVELDLTHDYAQLKKDIIHHCIYGVDKDSGAVDIARLRFWLSLVVDEQEPQPLPNLDFKIMQGDSLLENFEGIDLSKLLEGSDQSSKTGEQIALFSVVQEPTVEFNAQSKEKLSSWLDDFFEPQGGHQKAELQENIESLINRELDKAIQRYKTKLLFDLSEQRRSLAHAQAVKQSPPKVQKEIARLEAEVQNCEAKQTQLAEWQERPERPFFLWHTWFREIFDRGGFDIVIGNPPYVQLQRLGFYTDKLQAAGYETFARTGDLYCLFYEQALRLLSDGGVMAYITSNSWLKTIYGQPLRRYFVQHSTPVALLNFEDAQLFKEAIVETNILLALKGKHKVDTRAVAIGEDADGNKPLYEQLLENGDILTDLTDKEWIIGSALEGSLKKKIEDGKKVLGSLNVNINFGIKTGFNKAFIIDKLETFIELMKDPSSKEIIHPLLRGRDLKKYSYVYNDQWVIFTKRGTDINLYPAIKEYLFEYYDEIRPRNSNESTGRKPGPYQWFEIQDNVAYFREFAKPKILWGELSDAPKFSYDENGFYPEATLFFMTGEKLKYLLAILNSKVGEWYFNQISTTSGMGTNRWKKYKIEQLPIPNATPEQEQKIERLVEYVLWANANLQENPGPEARQRADYLEQIINGLVYELYLPEQLQEAKLSIFEHLGTLPPLEKGHEADIIEAAFQRLFDKTHKVRNALFYLRIIPEVRLIMEGVNKQKYDPSLIKWEDDHEYVS